MSNNDEIARLQQRHDRIVRAAADISFEALPRAAAAIVDQMKSQAPMLPAATDERQPGELRDSIVAKAGAVEVESGFALDLWTGGVSGLLNVTPVAEEMTGALGADPIGAVLISAGNDQVPYAAYVEFGTAKTPAEPFFYPAIRLMAQRTKQTVFGAWRKAISGAWEGG